MSRNIAISDDVYDRLKREKGERSFSEVIADALDDGGKLADVTGQGALDPESYGDAKEEIGRLSEGTVGRIEDETP